MNFLRSQFGGHARYDGSQEVWQTGTFILSLPVLANGLSPWHHGRNLASFLQQSILTFAGGVHGIQQSIAGRKGNAEPTLKLMGELESTS